MTLFDLDDACDDARTREDLLRLEDLKADIPTLKVTLFTIPGRCSPKWLDEMMARYDWIDWVQHGWLHRDCYECLSWSKKDCLAALRAARSMGFTTKGFKAPGWQISDGCYEALAEEGYWVADQEYNSKRWIPHLYSLGTYVITADGDTHLRNSPFIEKTYAEASRRVEKRTGIRPNCIVAGIEVMQAIHGHIGHLGGHNANALELIMNDIRAAAAKDSDFRFIREVME